MVKPEDLKVQMWFKNNKTKQPKPFSQNSSNFSTQWLLELHFFISNASKTFTNFNRVINFLGTFYPRLLRIGMNTASKKREKLRSSSREVFDTPFVVLCFRKVLIYTGCRCEFIRPSKAYFLRVRYVCDTRLLSDALRWIFFPFSLIDCNTAHTPTCDFSSWNKKDILLYDETS